MPGSPEQSLRFVAAVTLTFLTWTTSASAQQGASGGEWRVYGGDPGNSRYAPLDQIDRHNFAGLEVVWRWSARNFGPYPEIESQTVPLMVDGVLFATAGARRSVVAIDPATGETLWMWRMEGGERWEKAPRRNSGRGLAFWSDGTDRRILVVTPGFRLVALDADTGRPVTSFGRDGVVDLYEGLRWRDGMQRVGAIGNSSPPLVVGDVVVVGPALQIGLRASSPVNVPGDVRAFDARTGAHRWTFHTVPTPGEHGYDTWLEGSAEYSGNAGAWAPLAADPELGLVFVPVEAATSDLYGGHRLGANLFSSTLVALAAETGRRAWHYQIVHHDIWDYDIAANPILADVIVDGRPREVVVQLTKQAFAYVLDRATGEPIWPIEETPVPESDVPGEWTYPTQPIPSRPDPFDLQGLTEEDLNDLTPELRRQARERVARYRLGALYDPVSLADAQDGTEGTLMVPGADGGARWESGALDPETGILYVASVTVPTLIQLESDPESSDLNYVTRFSRPALEGAIPLTRPPWGRITAIDLNTGDHVWMAPNGDADPRVARHPSLRGVDLSGVGKPLHALTLVTRTLLIAGEGFGGAPFLHALDKRSGQRIGSVELPAPQVGLGTSYMHQGRQFIVFTVGAPGHPAELVALALPAGPGEDDAEEIPRRAPVLRPGSAASTQDGVYTPGQAQRGRRVYREVCVDCHAEDWYRGDVVTVWEGEPVSLLYELLSSTMPEDNPGSLTPDQYADMIAYIFALNGLPSGSQELPSRASLLSRIRIEWGR